MKKKKTLMRSKIFAKMLNLEQKSSRKSFLKIGTSQLAIVDFISLAYFSRLALQNVI